MSDQRVFSIEAPHISAVSKFRADAAQTWNAESNNWVNEFIPASDAIRFDLKYQFFSMQQEVTFTLSFLLQQVIAPQLA